MLDASQSTMKSLVNDGSWSTGASVNAVLRAAKADSAVSVHLKPSLRKRCVRVAWISGSRRVLQEIYT